jgi:hypothetical protein
MKSTGIINTTALFLLLGVATPAIALQEKPEKQEEKARPAQQEEKAKPEQRQQEAKAPKQEQAKPEKQQEAKAPKQASQPKPEKQQQATAPKQANQPKAEKQQQANAPKQEQSKPERQQQAAAPKQQQTSPQKQQQARQQPAKFSAPPKRSQQEVARQRAQPQIRLSARTSGRIPDDRFRSNFGRDHHFRIGTPVLVGGYSRFQYGGFWFGFVQPWPTGWYYTDDVYIDYVDGDYYMYNPYYPGARFSISVVI